MLVMKGREARAMAMALGLNIGGNKNGAISSRCAQGHYHGSKGEAARCNCLHLELRAGLILDLEVHPSIPLWAGRRYKADFRYRMGDFPSRRYITYVEDFKGAQSRDFQLVKKAWPTYGRGTLRETRMAGSKFFVKREIEGKWKK